MNITMTKAVPKQLGVASPSPQDPQQELKDSAPEDSFIQSAAESVINSPKTWFAAGAVPIAGAFANWAVASAISDEVPTENIMAPALPILGSLSNVVGSCMLGAGAAVGHPGMVSMGLFGLVFSATTASSGVSQHAELIKKD